MYKETQHTRFLSVPGEAEMCLGLFTDGEIETVGYCVVLMLELSHGFYLSRKSLTRHIKVVVKLIAGTTTEQLTIERVCSRPLRRFERILTDFSRNKNSDSIARLPPGTLSTTPTSPSYWELRR
jgi:hypothetical protein